MPTKAQRTVNAQLREQLAQSHEARTKAEQAYAESLGTIRTTQKERDAFGEQLERERDEHNRTRGLLMAAELSYAKLRGYVEGLEDSAPPRMIPEPRESALARMPDASQGTGGSGSAYYEATAGYQSYGRRDERKPWYYR